MKNTSLKSLLSYALGLGVLMLGAAFLLKFGSHVHAQWSGTRVSATEALSAVDMIRHYFHSPISHLLMQITVILIVSKIFGQLFRLIGQPTVIGEIIAGIVLGPSLLGWLLPNWAKLIFAPGSMGILQMLSQLGLILFIFVVGLELDIKQLKQKAIKSIVISHSSIFVSLIFGFALAIGLYQFYSPPTITFLPFALFIGIALSITAFPVLVRIVQERGLTNHPIGALAISCAAIDDISAWLMLSVAIAIVKAGSPTAAWLSIGLSIVYVCAMFLVVRPLITKLASKLTPHSSATFSILLVIMIVSAWITEIIGIHALFGAFLAGIACSGLVNIKTVIISKIEDLALLLLLPLFFAYSGLKTQIGLLSTPMDWAICGLIIIVAILGKLIGSGIAAKAVGESWYDSATIAILMNARGLVELVVLNIGYDLGVLNQTLFTMLVLMALVTTFMTGPSLDLINLLKRRLSTH